MCKCCALLLEYVLNETFSSTVGQCSAFAFEQLFEQSVAISASAVLSCSSLC